MRVALLRSASRRSPVTGRRRLALILGTATIALAQLAPAAVYATDPGAGGSPMPAASTPGDLPSPAVEPSPAPVEATPAPVDASPTESAPADNASPTDGAPSVEPSAPAGDPSAAPSDPADPSAAPSDAVPSDAAPSDAAPSEAPSAPVESAMPAVLTAQTVSFDSVPDHPVVGTAGLSIHATASGGTAIAYSSLTLTVCTVNAASGALVLLTPGTCTIQADAAADATYDVATNTSDVTVIRGCLDYASVAWRGALVLNADGTIPGCGSDAGHGAPADLKPGGWDASWDGWYGPSSSTPYSERYGYACDDCWIGSDGVNGSVGLPIGFSINFYGTTYSNVFVNSNGSISFENGSSNYDDPLATVLDGAAGVVPYAVDLDNRGLSQPDSAWTNTSRVMDFFYWGRTTYNGHQAFVATWADMQTYHWDLAKSDFQTFQILLVDVDGGAGSNVDIVLNYGGLTANDNGYDCVTDGDYYCVATGLGTYVDGNPVFASTQDDSHFLYDGQTTDAVADGGAHALRSHHLHSSTNGRYAYHMVNGQLPETATVPGAPVVTAVSGDQQGAALWGPPADDGGAPILAYSIQWRTDGAGAWEGAGDVTSPYIISQFDGSDLVNGTKYEVQVRATNGVGDGPWSASATFVAGAPHWTDTAICTFKYNVACSDGVAAAGNPTPSYSVSAGALPEGIVLDPVTGALSGKPSAPGAAYRFTLRATNDWGAITHAYAGNVSGSLPPLPDTATAPVTPNGQSTGAPLLELLAGTLGLALYLRREQIRKGFRQLGS